MKRQLTTFAFAGFLGLCCIGCPPAEEDPIDTSVDTELTEGDIDSGSTEMEMMDDSSNTTAAGGESAGLEMPAVEEVPEDELPEEQASEEESSEEEVSEETPEEE